MRLILSCVYLGLAHIIQYKLEVRYLIQKPDDFIDEFKEIGIVNLKQAINSFREFPFEKDLIETRQKEIKNRFSKIVFQSNDGKKVTIWAENNKGFFFCYENEKKSSQIFISDNFIENKEGLSVEYFLSLFFSENIEKELKLKKIKTNRKIRKQITTFSFNDFPKAYTLYNSIPWFVISVILIIYDFGTQSGELTYVHLVLSLFWLPALYLYISYWKINNNASITIDNFENILTYQKDEKKISFNRNEIDKCTINIEESTSSRSNTKEFSYLHIVLLTKEEIIITNFITEPYNIVELLNLNYKVNDRYMATFL